MRKFLLSFLLSLSILTSMAYAEFPKDSTFDFTETNTDKGFIGEITIVGEINKDTAEKFHYTIEKFRKDKVEKVIIHLNSPGGTVEAGYQIIKDMIKYQTEDKKNIMTYVGEKELCASMCTGIYAIGSYRVAAANSVWVFHSPYIKGKAESQEEQNKQDAIIEASRNALMAVYRVADANFANTILKPYVYGTAKTQNLILNGFTINELSDNFINTLSN